MDGFLLSSPSDRSYRNSRMMNHGGMGGLFPHPPSVSSLPPCFSSNQPPLLPLPIPKPYYSSLSNLPYPPPPPRNNNNNNKGRGRTRVTTLSTSPPTNKKKPKSSSKTTTSPKNQEAKSSENEKVLKSTMAPSVKVEEDGFEEMGGSIFSLAPPPSSLPLPKFSLKQKLSCNVEAVATASGIDDGATDNLRKLLHLC